MANDHKSLCWTLFGAGSGLGSLFLASGCSGSCGACYGCIGAGAAVTAVALLKKGKNLKISGGRYGMASRND